MQKKKTTHYELDSNAIKDIEAKLSDLLEICQIYRVPMFASVAMSNSDNQTQYKNIVYGGSSHVVNLFDDQIRKHILVSNGFEVVPAREEISLDMGEVISVD